MTIKPPPRSGARRALLFNLAVFAAFVSLAVLVPRAHAFQNGVEHFTLKNGMEVVVIPDHRAPVVTHMVWYRVGSADEPSGKSGLAHFLEHLMFKGTPSMAPGEFSKTIARNGGQDNAFTSADYTGYFQRVARDRLELVMELEADRMTNLTLTSAEIEPERGVIIEERRSRVDNRPSGRFSEQLNAAFYVSHPYGKPVIGWAREIQSLTRKDILDFYKRYYTPNNAILVVAGDITADQLKPLARKHYGAVPRRTEVPPRVRAVEPLPQAERRIILKDPRVRTPQLRRSYLTPAYATAGPGEAEAMDILAEVLGGKTTSRMYRQLVVDQKIAAGAGAWFAGDNLDHGRFGVYAVTAVGKSVEDLEKAIDQVIDDLVKDGPSEQEVEKAKRTLVASAVYARDSQQMLARIFGIALTTGQSVRDVIEWTDRIKAVDRDAVHKAARTYLKKVRSATGIMLPAKSKGTKRAQLPAGENKS